MAGENEAVSPIGATFQAAHERRYARDPEYARLWDARQATLKGCYLCQREYPAAETEMIGAIRYCRTCIEKAR